ncbi:MAG: NADH/ubiquinone/plastoquinone (complex I), partial [Chloroflexi bacterium]|nr:NADH/ubiquinone/plastoquinone (complex I) [Chloroflexota bacterium]
MPILIPAPLLLAALLVPLVALWRPRFAFPLTLAAAAGSTSAAALALAHTVDGASLSYALGGWSPPLGIEYRVDRIGAFVVLVTLSVALVVLIAVRRVALAEFSDRLGPFYGLVLLMLAGVTGMVVTFDLFNLFVFIEISSVASYALVFMGGPRGMVAGFRYLLIGSIGGGFYLLGVGFIYFATGSVNMGDVATLLPGLEGSRAVLAGAVFIFVGLALKMALFPLHLWLPDAYAYAPSSVNSMIAPVMTKAAAFAMLRMFLSVFPPGYLTDDVPIAGALMVMGLLGMVIGSALAVAQRDFRRMLAFSSIGQLGIIGVGIGLATPLGAAAALLHIMNHAVMKACLFVVAAAVRFRTGRTDIAGMAGLGR